MTTLYGISNCDAVRKARKWLEKNHAPYCFHDFRKDGIDRDQVQQWLNILGWERLINRRSSTWKELDDKTRELLSGHRAAEVVVQYPTLIKRPLLEYNGQLYVGFDATAYAAVIH